MADATSTKAATPGTQDNSKNGSTRERIPWKIEVPTPDDVPTIVDVQWNAWVSERMQNLFPHTESGRRYSERDHLLNVTGQPHRPGNNNVELPEPQTMVRVVRDPSGSGKAVAFAIWRHMRPGDDWGWEACWSAFGDIPDIRLEIVEGMFGPSRRIQRLVMDGGREHLLLEALATLDSHRGQGIGTALVKWGNAYADARGLPSFLLASPQGRTVYEKVGYAEKDVSNLTDEKPFSLPMVRPGKEPN